MNWLRIAIGAITLVRQLRNLWPKKPAGNEPGSKPPRPL